MTYYNSYFGEEKLYFQLNLVILAFLYPKFNNIIKSALYHCFK